MFTPDEQQNWLANIRTTSAEAGGALRDQAQVRFRGSKLYAAGAVFAVGSIFFAGGAAGLAAVGALMVAYACEDLITGRNLLKRGAEQMNLAQLSDEDLLVFVQARNSDDGLRSRVHTQINWVKRMMIRSWLAMAAEGGATVIFFAAGVGYISVVVAAALGVMAIISGMRAWGEGKKLKQWRTAQVGDSNESLLNRVEKAEQSGTDQEAPLKALNGLLDTGVHIRPADSASEQEASESQRMGPPRRPSKA